MCMWWTTVPEMREEKPSGGLWQREQFSAKTRSPSLCWRGAFGAAFFGWVEELEGGGGAGCCAAMAMLHVIAAAVSRALRRQARRMRCSLAGFLNYLSRPFHAGVRKRNVRPVSQILLLPFEEN